MVGICDVAPGSLLFAAFFPVILLRFSQLRSFHRRSLCVWRLLVTYPKADSFRVKAVWHCPLNHLAGNLCTEVLYNLGFAVCRFHCVGSAGNGHFFIHGVQVDGHIVNVILFTAQMENVTRQRHGQHARHALALLLREIVNLLQKRLLTRQPALHCICGECERSPVIMPVLTEQLSLGPQLPLVLGRSGA